MAYSVAYDTYRTPQTMSKRTLSTSNRPFSGMYEDLTRYPYGEPVKGGFDDYSSQRREPNYVLYPSPNQRNHFVPTYEGSDHTDPSEYEYTASYNPTMQAPAKAGVIVPSRSRRSTSMSYTRSSYHDSYGPRHGGGGTVVPGSAPTIKFRAKGAVRPGVSVAEAVGGAKLSGGDYVKWHEINADARGRIHLRIKWNGYSALTYEIPVDGYENRVRLSSLVRRVGRAVIHFMQSNGIPIGWENVKLYHLEEVSQGVWQPALTIR